MNLILALMAAIIGMTLALAMEPMPAALIALAILGFALRRR